MEVVHKLILVTFEVTFKTHMKSSLQLWTNVMEGITWLVYNLDSSLLVEWRMLHLPDSQAKVFDVSSLKIISTACLLVPFGILVTFFILLRSVTWKINICRFWLSIVTEKQFSLFSIFQNCSARDIKSTLKAFATISVEEQIWYICKPSNVCLREVCYA